MQGKQGNPKQRGSSPSPLTRAEQQSEGRDKRGQTCLPQPEESSCRHNTPVTRAMCVCGGELLKEALIGESPNIAVRFPLRASLVDHHFQNHQGEPSEGSGKRTETGAAGERSLPRPQLVPGVRAAAEGAGEGAPTVQPEGAEQAPCPAEATPGTSGARGPQAAGLRAGFPRSARPDSHLPRGDRGRLPGLAPGAEAAAAARRWGGGERRRGRAGAAGTGSAALLRGAPGASLAVFGKLPRPHDPP